MNSLRIAAATLAALGGGSGGDFYSYPSFSPRLRFEIQSPKNQSVCLAAAEAKRARKAATIVNAVNKKAGV